MGPWGMLFEALFYGGPSQDGRHTEGAAVSQSHHKPLPLQPLQTWCGPEGGGPLVGVNPGGPMSAIDVPGF